MKDRSLQNIKVGLLVLAGLIIFTLALYMIGKKDNLFKAGFTLNAKFKDVKGLLIGNNVRFSGINIGTVKDLEIINDSTVKVVMNIQEKAHKHIRINTIASIGTDGGIGNKIVILTSTSGNSAIVKNGDEINSLSPFDSDASLRNLEDTGTEITVIAKNIREISDRIKNSSSLWNFLADNTMGPELRSTFSNIYRLSSNVNGISEEIKVVLKDLKSGKGNLAILLNDTTLSRLSVDLNKILDDINNGKGTLGTLISDDIAAENLQNSLLNIKVISDSLASMSHQLVSFSRNIDSGAKIINSTVSDSLFLYNLSTTMKHLSSSSVKLDENLEALQHSFLFKAYFKKLEKEKKRKIVED